MHGHNWKITVEVGADSLNNAGMIIDFSAIKKVLYQLDHENLSALLPFNPTAENIAYWIYTSMTEMLLKECSKGMRSRVLQVTVQECEGNVACYRP
jgi:6-pyruvoyltetrahydropterin/6-carboxytetrahydropterin synthase